MIPVNDFVVLEQAKAEEKTPGGLFVPQTAQERTDSGKVVAVGPGYRLENGDTASLQVQIGDEVVFRKHAAADVKINGKDYLVLREQDIMCITQRN